METKTQWRLLLSIIFGVLLCVPIISLIIIPPVSIESFFIRLAALWGLIGLVLASLMNFNKKILYQKFGLKFIKLHHSMALFAVITATLHPLIFAISVSNPLVFLPDFSSWYAFWSLGGRPALILIYIAVIAGLLRKKSKKAWKYIHRFIYLALILVIVHGILIGTDFQNIVILILFTLLTMLGLLTGIYSRIKDLKKKKK